MQNIYQVVLFLSDICQVAKFQPLGPKEEFFSNLIKENILKFLLSIIVSCPPGDSIVPYYLISQQELATTRAAEILGNLFQICAEKIKIYIINQEQTPDGNKFLNSIAKAAITSTIAGVRIELIELLKSLIDPESQGPKDKISELFYGQCMKLFTDFIVESKAKPNPFTEETTVLLMDLINYCVRNHTYRIRYYLTKNDTLSSLVFVLSSAGKSVKLAFIRIYKSIVTKKDETLNSHIANKKLLKPIITLLTENINHRSMIFSSIVDLLLYIYNERLATLINYISADYQKELSDARLGNILPTFSPLSKEAHITESAISALNLDRSKYTSSVDNMEDDIGFTLDQADIRSINGKAVGKPESVAADEQPIRSEEKGKKRLHHDISDCTFEQSIRII
jgi:protein phosphatase-4 regulatory subunit 3